MFTAAALLPVHSAGLAVGRDSEVRYPVPEYPNVRVVDYGNDMGHGFYRVHPAKLFSGPKGDVRVDSDGDGSTADDSVSGWRFSVDEPFNPMSDYYNYEAPSAVFYGGIIAHHSNNPGARVHVFRDVTAVGFYIFKDSLTGGVISVKWHSFECCARVGRPERVSSVMEMARVPADRHDEKDVPAFHMSRTEVPYAAWKKIYTWAVSNQYCTSLDQTGYVFDHDGDMGSMDWRTGDFNHAPEEPVADIGWFDARLFCNALSEMQGRTPCYYVDSEKTQEKIFRTAVPWRIRMIAGRGYARKDRTGVPIYTKWEADGYRLPTWAEWSIAWRAGDTAMHPWHSPPELLERDGQREWLKHSSDGHTHPAGLRQANPLGIYDLGGNGSEWLQDTPVDDYYRSENPKGDERYGLFGIAFAGAHFNSAAQGVARRPHVNKKSAGWPWLGLRVVRCDAGVNVEKPFTAKIVLDVKDEDYNPLQGRTFRGNLRRTGYFGERGIASIKGAKWTCQTGGPVRSSPSRITTVTTS